MSDDSPTLSENEYQVGYCRPPKHTQFKPGNNANPYGRAKRDRADFAASIRSTHVAKVEVRQGQRKRTLTRIEANILSLLEKAKRGGLPAANRLLDIYESKTGAAAQGPRIVEIHNALPEDDGDDSGRLTPKHAFLRSKAATNDPG